MDTDCFSVRGKTICGEAFLMSSPRGFPKNFYFHTDFTLLSKNHVQGFSFSVSLYLLICYWNHNVAIEPRLILGLEACQVLQIFYNWHFIQVIYSPNQKVNNTYNFKTSKILSPMVGYK